MENNNSILRVAICEFLACFIAVFIPIFGIPFAFVAVSSAYESKNNFYKVTSIIVACFVALLVIYWLVSIPGTINKMSSL